MGHHHRIWESNFPGHSHSAVHRSGKQQYSTNSPSTIPHFPSTPGNMCVLFCREYIVRPRSLRKAIPTNNARFDSDTRTTTTIILAAECTLSNIIIIWQWIHCTHNPLSSVLIANTLFWCLACPESLTFHFPMVWSNWRAFVLGGVLRECPITAIMLFCYYSSANSTTIFSQGISSSLPFIPGNWYRRWLVRILMPMNGRCPRGVCVVLSFNEAKWKSIDCKNRFGFYDFWAHANLNNDEFITKQVVPLTSFEDTPQQYCRRISICSIFLRYICEQIHPIGG